MRRLFTRTVHSSVHPARVLLAKPPPVCRNAALGGLFEGSKTPKPVKTGTTIAGLVFKASIQAPNY